MTYSCMVEMPTAMVTATVKENRDGTISLLFENEHGEYGLALSPQESAELRTTLAAVERRIVGRGALR